MALLLALAATACTSDRSSPGALLQGGTIGGRDVPSPGPEPVASPHDVEIEIRKPQDEQDGPVALRRQALKEAAQSYGSQMGYARRAWEIMEILRSHSARLGTVYDFSRVTAAAPAGSGVVVPPVVSRDFAAYEGDLEGTEAAVADEYLTLIRPGTLRPVQPTWRDWLLFGSSVVKRPALSLWPKDSTERDLFEGWFVEGWQAGMELATAEMSARLDRINRDYVGMLQYRRLVALGMMERIVLREWDHGITGSASEMRIGSRTVRIVSPAEFSLDPRTWSAAVVSDADRDIVSSGGLPSMSDLGALLQ